MRPRILLRRSMIERESSLMAEIAHHEAQNYSQSKNTLIHPLVPEAIIR